MISILNTAAFVRVAGMAFSALMFCIVIFMVVAMHIGIKRKGSCKQRIYRCVSISCNTAVKPNSRLCQCRLRTCTNAAANQHFSAQ